jgi:CRP-like cAMP-binding protein
MSEAPKIENIFKSALGDELTKQECQTLASIMGARRLHAGETLVTEGELDTALFVLVEGKLAVTSVVDGEEVDVYTMTEGECAGTRAFVDRTPRKATLRAVGDTLVYTLDPDKFEGLLEDHPKIVYKIMRALFRITHTNLMRMNKESQALTNYISKTGGRF